MNSTRCDCSLVLPTRNRRAVLEQTLHHIHALSTPIEVIVVDNGSTDDTPELKRVFPAVRWIELGRNLGSAARNVGAAAARSDLLLMLDDDSWPAPGTIERLVTHFAAQPDLGAAACRVRLPHSGRHDAGGVPGIFFNCGGAIRRSAFVAVGGFPIDFDYYVEEYDFCCRLWRTGWRVEPLGDGLVWHQRSGTNRDNDRMLRLLVRNNLKTWHRYAPLRRRTFQIESELDRYRRVAQKEGAMRGFQEGLDEGRELITSDSARRVPMTDFAFESLFGLPTARRVLRDWTDKNAIRQVALWSRGKGCEFLVELLNSLGIRIVAVYDSADAVGTDERWQRLPLLPDHLFKEGDVDGLVAGSLSPGIAEDICLDLRDRFASLPIVSAAPWQTLEPDTTAAIYGRHFAA